VREKVIEICVLCTGSFGFLNAASSARVAQHGGGRDSTEHNGLSSQRAIC